MNKSYIEITKSCKLFSYSEGPQFRVEVWKDSGCTWACKWFYSNNGEFPNTITKELNAEFMD